MTHRRNYIHHLTGWTIDQYCIEKIILRYSDIDHVVPRQVNIAFEVVYLDRFTDIIPYRFNSIGIWGVCYVHHQAIISYVSSLSINCMSFRPQLMTSSARCDLLYRSEDLALTQEYRTIQRFLVEAPTNDREHRQGRKRRSHFSNEDFSQYDDKSSVLQKSLSSHEIDVACPFTIFDSRFPNLSQSARAKARFDVDML